MRRPSQRFSAVLLAGSLILFTACGSATSSGTGNSGMGGTGAGGGGATTGSVPQFSNVVLVAEENHSYSEVIGNGAMPFLNQLAAQNALATQYFADAHPSIPNYFMLTTGQPITFDDNFAGIVADDNIVRELVSAGKSWKVYAESLPAPGYTGNDVLPQRASSQPLRLLD